MSMGHRIGDVCLPRKPAQLPDFIEHLTHLFALVKYMRYQPKKDITSKTQPSFVFIIPNATDRLRLSDGASGPSPRRRLRRPRFRALGRSEGICLAKRRAVEFQKPLHRTALRRGSLQSQYIQMGGLFIQSLHSFGSLQALQKIPSPRQSHCLIERAEEIK